MPRGGENNKNRNKLEIQNENKNQQSNLILKIIKNSLFQYKITITTSFSKVLNEEVLTQSRGGAKGEREDFLSGSSGSALLHSNEENSTQRRKEKKERKDLTQSREDTNVGMRIFP